MAQHAARKHSKWNSSGASRWAICLGQPNKAENYPEKPDTKYSLEGTAAHEVLEHCVNAFIARQSYEASRFTNAPSIVQSVSIVMDYLTKLRNDYPDLVVEGERRVWFPQDIVPQEDCGGTLDVFAYSPIERMVWIIDFKHGEGVSVEIIGNAQLLSYFCARCLGLDFGVAVLVIIQPRCRHRLGPVREWEVNHADLIRFIDEIDETLRIGSRPDAPLVAGDHCRWCPCIHDCDARDSSALAAMQQDFSHLKDLELWQPPEPGTMPVDKLLLIKRHATQIKAWLDAIDDALLHAAVHQGIELAGYKVVEAQSRRAWLEDQQKVAAELIALSGNRLTWDDVWPRKLATITETETRLVQFATADVPHGWKEKAAEAMRERIAHLTDRKSSGNLTLAPSSDNRPTTSKLAQDFGHVVGSLEPADVPKLTYGAMPAPIVEPKTLIRED